MAAAFAGAQALQPDEQFEPRCQNLVRALKAVVERMCSKELLPEGTQLVPFGSYAQGTCLLGATLDIALVPAGDADADSDIAEAFAGFLIQHHATAFERAPADDDADPAVRLLAGDFRGTSRVSMQGIALYRGDAATGAIDQFIRKALAARPGAIQFVRLVKGWALQCRLARRATGGSFPWTLLALSCLQQQGFLPGFRDILGASSSQLHEAPDADPLHMFRCFSGIVLDYISGAGPHQVMSLWTAPGSGVLAQPARVPLPSGESAPPLEEDFVRTFGDSVFQQLQQLNSELGAHHALPDIDMVATWARGMSMFRTPPPSHHIAWSPGTVTPWTPFGSSPHREQHQFGPSYFTDISIPPFPFMSHEMAVQAWPPERPQGPPPGLSLPSPGPYPPQRPPPEGTQDRFHRKTWVIDDHWAATCTTRGRVIETIQLDPAMCLDLSPKSWERRMNRREHQIRIAKATSEYSSWVQLKESRGWQEGDPETPRVADQNSKRYFETSYKEWRVALHAAVEELKSVQASQRLPARDCQVTTGGRGAVHVRI